MVAGKGFSTWTIQTEPLADNDLFAITDISDVTQSDDGSSKQITSSQISEYIFEDSAGEGVATKGWSADKLTEMFNTDLSSFANNITVAKTGGDFDTIQAAIDFAVTEYPDRTLNNPVVITIHPGEYREQIHSYQNIIIQSSVASYDTSQGQAKVTIINAGDTPADYPLRTQLGDVYYMIGISIYTDAVDGVLGRLFEGTFKNCSTRYGHFIENDIEFTNTQFKTCKFNNNTYGGFNIGSGIVTSGSIIKLDECIHFGNPTFLSTHPDPTHFGFIGANLCDIRGAFNIAGDWGVQGLQMQIGGVIGRNTFDTTSEVKFEGGYMVNGMHFVSNPGTLFLGKVSFESIADNMIPDGETDITADVPIYGNILDNVVHNGFPSQIHMNNPDKFVGKSQRDGYISVKAALDSITDSSAEKRYTIQVSAGIYVENNPLQGKEYVNLKAIGDLQTTRIMALNPTQDLIIMSTFFTIEGFALWGVTGPTNYVVNQSVAGMTSITRCFFAECSNGVLIDNVDAMVSIGDCSIYNPTATTTIGVHCKSGNVNIHTLSASVGATVTLLEITGANTTVTANDIRSDLDTLTTGVSVKDLANVDIMGAKLLNMNTGIELEGGSHVNVNGSRIGNSSGDGIRINDVGSNTILNIQSTSVKNNVGYDFNFLSPTCLGEGMVSSSLNNLNFVEGVRIYGMILDLEEGEEGMTILGELHVGTPESPTKSVFGEGGSYTRGLIAYTWDGATYTDISTNVASSSLSTFTFPNTAIGTAIYITSDIITNRTSDYHKFFGLKSNIITSQFEGIIEGEYYNGTDWVQFTHMTSQSNSRYHRKSDRLFTVPVGEYQIRFNPSMDNDWVKTNNPSAGAVDRFWIRFRITSPPAVNPVFEQFKIHSNRHEINGDGFEEDMGTARAYKSVPVPWNVFNDIDTVVGNQNLWLSTNCKSGFINNSMTVGDSIGAVTSLPSWVDTSAPLRLRVSAVPSVTGNYTLTVFLNSSSSGTVISLTDPVNTTGETSDIQTVACIANQQAWWVFNLDISDKGWDDAFSNPESIWLNIKATTIAGTLNGIQFDVEYLSWRRGSHI